MKDTRASTNPDEIESWDQTSRSFLRRKTIPKPKLSISSISRNFSNDSLTSLGSSDEKTSPTKVSTPRLKRATTHQGINETLIKHQLEQWKEVKAGVSPRDKVINKFEIGRPIGKGGSGAKIHECRLYDGGKFAVKIFDKEFLTERHIETIRKEREIMEQIPYHNSLTYYKGHYETDKHIYIFMSLHNENLMTYLTNLNKPLSLEQVVKLAIDILTGISILHECNIIHRDIKSPNIFINYGSDNQIHNLTVGDFDTAKKIGPIDGTKTCIGTTLWVAPEVLNVVESKTNTYTFSADIWSFGMVLYELMTCKQPYYEDNKRSLSPFLKILEGRKPDLTKEEEEKYKPILGIWERCLSLNHLNRPKADELLVEFEKIYLLKDEFPK